MKKKICIVTGTRAEFGLMHKIIDKLNESFFFEIKLVVTGAHLSKLHGFTINNIKKHNVPIDYELNMLLSNDDSTSIVKSIGVEILSLADYFKYNKFDAVMILGDRYELLGVVLTALIYQVKIIHIGGGDKTEGAYDNDIRNAITQLSDLHFVTCDESKNNVLSLGKKNVYVVGNPGLENLINFVPSEKIINNYILFIYHPETKANENLSSNIKILENMINHVLSNNMNIIVIGSNADNNNIDITNMYKKFFGKITYFDSLDRHEYLSCIYHCGLFIGNSSSGIYEAPYFKKYVINIGDRQTGRLMSKNIINSKYDFHEITNHIDQYFGKNTNGEHVYPVLPSSEIITNILINHL